MDARTQADGLLRCRVDAACGPLDDLGRILVQNVLRPEARVARSGRRRATMSMEFKMGESMPHDLDVVKLLRADMELALCPSVGGGAAAFRFRGIDVLRPASREAIASRTPTELGAFPLFPFSGRIAEARFRFANRDINLEPNFAPEPHAIHGRAWQNVWHLDEHTQTSASLVYESASAGAIDDWPWPYRATQRFMLEDDGLTLSLSITNAADEAMPAGLGWHPYFRRDDARLTADVREIWRSGDDMIPAGPSPVDESNDLRTARDVCDLEFDDAFGVGESPTEIEWPATGIRASLVATKNLRHLIVYTPPGEDFFCAEPVSHAPDALNSRLPLERTGLVVLAPGERLEAEIRLGVEALP